MARTEPGFAGLALLWNRGGAREDWGSGPLSKPLQAATELAIARSDGVPCASAGGDGIAIAWHVAVAEGWLALALQTTPGNDDMHRWQALIDSARVLGVPLLEQHQLRANVHRLEAAERLQTALYSIADMVSSQLEMPQMLRELHKIVGRLMYAENFYIVLYDGERQTVRYIYFADTVDPYVAEPEHEIPIGERSNSLTVELLRHGQPLMGSAQQLRKLLGTRREARHGPDSLDWLGVPMLAGEQVRGAVVVQSYERSAAYGDEDRALLSYVAQHILTALDRKQAQGELERRVRERTRELAIINLELRSEVAERQRAERVQAALFRIAELSISADSMEEFYAAVHAEVDELIDARNFFIALLSDDGSELQFPYSVDERDPERQRRQLAHGLTEYVLRIGQPVLADRLTIQKLVEAGELHTFGPRSECWLGVPLMRDDGVVGVIAVQSYSPDILFNARDQELLTFISFHIASGLMRKRAQDHLKAANAQLEERVEARTRELADTNNELRGQITERERAEQRLTYQAMHDGLTGLPNRARMLERLQRAMARYYRNPESQFAVLFLDLDRFKVVNDSMGHLVGDELLKQAGRLVAGAVRLPDTVARLGGDEFAVLVEDISGPEEACEVALRIIIALAAPIHVEDKELFTSASIGIAMVAPGYHAGEELLRDADVAMYRAKNKGRNRFELFDEELRHEALRVHDLEGELRRAIANGQFEPFFQPIVRLSDGLRIGYEALLRWRHEEHGILLPQDFLSVAEESGLIEQIDWMMYEATCSKMARVARDGEYVSINVSPTHFRSPDLAERLLALAERHQVRPGHLRIELTEGALLDDSALARETLEQLRAGGIWAQLDDFGTGYSALSYLHKFPITSLKIDRSFIADLAHTDGHASEAVVRAILAMANSLSIEVVGEGIETPAQRNILAALGCQYGQGFLFARPEPAPDVTPP